MEKIVVNWETPEGFEELLTFFNRHTKVLLVERSGEKMSKVIDASAIQVGDKILYPKDIPNIKEKTAMSIEIQDI